MMRHILRSLTTRINPLTAGGRRRLGALPAIIGVLALTAACASMGNPSGGPRDEDPPRFVRSNPAPGSRNFSGDKINIDFNEYITLQDAMSKVVVSPPGASMPRVSSQGHRVSVELKDTLQPNTTYTIDFANSIQDNNEGNPLQGFTFTFSTGPDIDTLRISGMVLSADALEPQQGMLVGIHPAEAGDSAFTTTRFSRMAKTDDQGRFTIYGLRPGEYRVYALADMDGDMHYANPEEDMAFYPLTVSPTSERIETTDTIFNLLTGEVDSIQGRMRTRFLPNDLLLRSFNVGRRQQFIEKYERPDSARITLRFNASADSLPRVWPAGHPEWWEGVVTEHSATNDTIQYWLPPVLASRDTLSLAVTYLRADSLGRMVDVADTLSLITPRRKAVKQKDDKKSKHKKDKSDEEETTRREPSLLKLEVAGKTPQEVYLPLLIDFSRPLARLDTAAIRLEQRHDSVWGAPDIPYTITMNDPLSPRRLTVSAPWEYERKYRIVADTLAATDIYGAVSDPWNAEFSARPENEYSSLTLTLQGLPDSVPAYVDLLNQSENVIRRAPVNGGKAYMPYLASGKYYARVVLDYDGDGQYTTGDYAVGRQPEPSFYCPKVINVRKNWDADQTWDVFAIPVDTQKPNAIRKNKPEKSRNQQSEFDEEETDEEDDGTYDPDYNPFDPNSRKRTANTL